MLQAYLPTVKFYKESYLPELTQEKKWPRGRGVTQLLLYLGDWYFYCFVISYDAIVT